MLNARVNLIHKRQNAIYMHYKHNYTNNYHHHHQTLILFYRTIRIIIDP